jgi:c-di-GMP-binding flagellar brake protein YcgR
MGPSAYVFSETIDISHGGTCLRQPNRFVVQAGEQLNLASAHIGSSRPARVVHISPRGVHCAFDEEISPPDSIGSAAL